MNAALLLAYLVLLGLAYGRSRSLAWLVITTAGAVAVSGSAVSFAMDRGHNFTQIELQVLLLATLMLVALLAWIPALGSGMNSTEQGLGDGEFGWKRQALTMWLPIVLLLVFLAIVTTLWTEEPAFLRPVAFLIGHDTAEDNAKWLDFTAQWASGSGIEQPVPLGGPLQLFLTFVGTAMGVGSQFLLGGYNEVAVAANSVVFGQLLMVVLVPLALAPIAEMRINGWGAQARIPAPFIWLGALVLSSATLVVTAFGHLTLQFTFLVVGLWCAAFISAVRVRRARLVTSIAVAASMTVWLPLNVVAVVIVVGWATVLISRGFRDGWRAADPLGLVLLALVAVGVFQPIYSSLTYLLSATGSVGAGSAPAAGMAVGAMAPVALVESVLFAATGGTETTGPILGILAVAAVVVSGVVLARRPGPLPTSLGRRYVPLAILTFFAFAIYVIDFWSTGTGPNYGATKFTFMVAVVAVGIYLPIALMVIDPARLSRMSALRWIAVGGVLMLLTVDSLLPRAVALARPQQWSPPIPFNNSGGGYWWPAEVNGEAVQPISTAPVACLYLPEGSSVPTAIVPSGLSDPQRVYACSRQLAGLSGSDAEAQPLVDWLRREWLTNTPAWSDVYDSLASMPDSVLDKPIIVLDDGSNVIGLETMRALLARYPKAVAAS